MAEHTETTQEAQTQFWDQLDSGHICMLWIPETDQHPQPMTFFADQDNSAIWFITASDTDLAGALASTKPARMTFNAKRQDYQCSIAGDLTIVQDEAKLDELWNLAVAAWFDGGRDDPKVRLLRFDPKEAAMWATDGNSVMVGLKLLKAGVERGTGAPDIGVHHVIEFDRAA